MLEWLGYIVHGTRDSLATSNVADVFNSIVNMIGTLTTIIVILLSASLAHRFGKKAVAVVGFGTLDGQCICFFISSSRADVNWHGGVDDHWFAGLCADDSVGCGPSSPTWRDYSEWKTGRRFTGMVFATIGFALKAGLALGSASFLWLMAGLFRYDTQLPAAPDAVAGYRALSGIAVGVMFAICTGLLIIYKLNKRQTIEMADELAARRRKVAV